MHVWKPNSWSTCSLKIYLLRSLHTITQILGRFKRQSTKGFFFYKTRNNLYFETIKIVEELLNSLIIPILCYDSEIWIFYAARNLELLNLLLICDKLPAEILKLKACKSTLRVTKTTTNHAVHFELGEFPIILFIIIC